MSKFIKIGLLLISVMLLGLFLTASMQPETYEIERSTSVSAPAETIYATLADLEKFNSWSPWAKLDPNLQKTVSGEPGTLGATYTWQGNDDVGSGRMTITAVQPNKRIDLKLEFLSPFTATSETAWEVNGDVDPTLVTWRYKGNNDGFVAKVMYLFIDMDQMLGADFEKGLLTLKELVEESHRQATSG